MAFLLALALAATAPSAAADDGNTVVVTATLPALLNALEHCKQGGCTPRKDIIASIRYAEAVFRAGRYYDAQHVLQQAIARDKGAATTDPNAVAALYEATVTAALHNGDQDVARRASFARAAILRDNLASSGDGTLVAELDTIDLIFRAGRSDEAVQRYGTLASKASAAHQPEIAAAAIMRQAGAYHVIGSERKASALLKPIVDDDGLPAAYRIAARALSARFARDRGDKTAIDALIAAVGVSDPGNGPMLLWQPPLPNPVDPAAPDYYNRVNLSLPQVRFFGVGWADVGFTIKSDGTVDMPEILRGSRDHAWARPILAMIAQRRYTQSGTNKVPSYRIERWTLTANYGTEGGSLIRRRTHNPHYEQVDLTPAAPASS